MRISLAFAVTWWSLFTMATGAARGVTQFIGARLMLGVGEAASLPSFTKTAFNWFPAQRARHCLRHLQQRLDGGIGTVAAAGDGADRRGGLARRLCRHRRDRHGLGAGLVVHLSRSGTISRHRAGTKWMRLLAERSGARPRRAKISWLDLFRYRSIWGLMIGLFCLNFAIYFFITWFPTYLLQARGFSLAALGTWARCRR